jgi:hypothetical protein
MLPKGRRSARPAPQTPMCEQPHVDPMDLEEMESVDEDVLQPSSSGPRDAAVHERMLFDGPLAVVIPTTSTRATNPRGSTRKPRNRVVEGSLVQQH